MILEAHREKYLIEMNRTGSACTVVQTKSFFSYQKERHLHFFLVSSVQALKLATIPLGGFLLPGAVDFLAAIEILWVVVADVASFACVDRQQVRGRR